MTPHYCTATVAAQRCEKINPPGRGPRRTPRIQLPRRRTSCPLANKNWRGGFRVAAAWEPWATPVSARVSCPKSRACLRLCELMHVLNNEHKSYQRKVQQPLIRATNALHPAEIQQRRARHCSNAARVLRCLSYIQTSCGAASSILAACFGVPTDRLRLPRRELPWPALRPHVVRIYPTKSLGRCSDLHPASAFGTSRPSSPGLCCTLYRTFAIATAPSRAGMSPTTGALPNSEIRSLRRDGGGSVEHSEGVTPSALF